ncbi:putative N-acetyltransferase YsnE [bacterium YEK0313]|nr:putative N-acetyltransferase YsnE [bacterium YEK0313]
MTQYQPETASVDIREEDPAQPDIVALLAQGEANSAALYPAESNHHLPLEALRRPNVRFFVARAADGTALATGAIVLHGDWAEIKRMWVIEPARGRGLSRRVLARLIACAEAEDVGVLRLETGVASHAALGLYAGMGFAPRGPFADYAEDPLSVFMEKRL